MDCEEDEGGKVEELEGSANRVESSDRLGEGQLIVAALGIDLGDQKVGYSGRNLPNETNDGLENFLGEGKDNNGSLKGTADQDTSNKERLDKESYGDAHETTKQAKGINDGIRDGSEDID